MTPHLIVPADFTDGDNTVTVPIDLTVPFAEMAAKHPARLKEILAGARPYLSDVVHALTEEQRRIAYKGGMRLVSPDYEERLKAFVVEAGLDRNPKALHQHLRQLESQRRAVTENERLLENVRTGTLTDDEKYTGMVCLPGIDDEDGYKTDIEYLKDDWGYEEYKAKNPAPNFFDEEEKYRVWEQGYSAWRDANFPPFVHGTNMSHLADLKVSDLLETYHDHDYESICNVVENTLESLLDDHYEDAIDDLVGQDKLHEDLAAWEAAKKDPETGRLPASMTSDPELEAIITEFNENQTLHSFMVDFRILVPSRAGVTNEDCIAWVEKELAEAKEHLRQAEAGWQPPAANSDQEKAVA